MLTTFRFDLKSKAKKLRRDMTPAEKRLWFGYLRNQASQKFLRQRPMGNFIVDFYCAAKRLVIEVDGDSHFINDEAVNYDLARENFLREKLGLKILRFTNLDVTKNFAGVCKAIEEALG